MMFLAQMAGLREAWTDQTILNPLGFAALLALGTAMLLVPRRYAVVPIIIMACLIAPGQRIYVMGMNFTLLRLMVVFGWIRVLARREGEGFQWCILDYLMIAWAVVGTIMFVMLWGTFDSLIERSGEVYDALGMYFLFRCLVRNWEDIDTIVKWFVIIAIPVLLAFLVEHATGHNLFAFLGGVPAITMIRDGRLRCQGAFAHPILAGTFWAAVIPLMAAEWWCGKLRHLWVYIGIIASLGIIVLCASSGPVAAVGLAIVGACFFPFRRHMRAILIGGLCVAGMLQLVMHNPIWHLLDRIDLAGGSTGWYRYYLINQTVNHFGEWWLRGVRSTASWGGAYGPLTDITNQYVWEGIRGGIWSLGLFVAIIVVAFRCVGKLWRRGGDNIGRVAMAWGLGVALFVHVTSFISVSYFGQIIVVWYLTLGTIGSLEVRSRRSVGVPQKEVRLVETGIPSSPLHSRVHARKLRSMIAAKGL